MLALDPYYEMFPSSYRRSYRYSDGFGTVVAKRSGVGVAIGVGIGVTALSIGALLFARQR